MHHARYYTLKEYLLHSLSKLLRGWGRLWSIYLIRAWILTACGYEMRWRLELVGYWTIVTRRHAKKQRSILDLHWHSAGQGKFHTLSSLTVTTILVEILSTKGYIFSKLKFTTASELSFHLWNKSNKPHQYISLLEVLLSHRLYHQIVASVHKYNLIDKHANSQKQSLGAAVMWCGWNFEQWHAPCKA